jgi:hypothetical protein
MSNKPIIVFSFLFLLFTSSITQASSYALTTRQLPTGEYEAVVTYDTGGSCFVEVSPASTVDIVGFEISIISPEHAIPPLCLGPILPIEYFEKRAHIGPLAPGQYTVSWMQPRAFDLSTSLQIPGESPIPSNATWALILLILGVLAVAHFTPRLRARSGPK